MEYRKMWVGTEPGTHLDKSRSGRGGYRATARSSDNRLVGQAELFPVEDEPNDERDSVLLGALAGLAVVGLSVGAAAVFKGVRERRDHRLDESASTEHQVGTQTQDYQSAPAGWYDTGQDRLRWWNGRQWTEHFRSVSPTNAPPGWYDAGHGRQRWWDGHRWTSHFQPPLNTASPALPHYGEDPRAPQSHDVRIRTEPVTISMSRAEWEGRIRAMVLARAFSEEQWFLLSHARIVDGDPELLQCQGSLRKLTPGEFEQLIPGIFDARSVTDSHGHHVDPHRGG